MHIHILGIGGTFMGGIAAIALQKGYKVTGCDGAMYPPMSTQLEKLGIDAVAGYDASQLETVAKSAQVFVIGNALSRGNPLVEAILDRGLNYTSGPQWLSEHVLRASDAPKHVIAVAGTHGKTTTASMVAWILESAGLSPGFLIGGIPSGFNVSARLTPSPYFVIEADEYDTAFFDKRSKFLHYHPRTAILNNLEYDHADIFPDLISIETQFHHLVRTVPHSGRLIINLESESIANVIARGCWSEVETFASTSPTAHWHLTDNGELLSREFNHGALSVASPGLMNQMNAMAAIAAANHVGVKVSDAMAAMATFPGVARRLQTRGVARGVTLYDDFAHHPTAIHATIAALRQKIGDARILAVFEPRSNTMKLGTMRTLLASSLRDANAVFCYSGGIDWDAQEALAPLGAMAMTSSDLSVLIDAVAREARAGDHILVMSNGGFNGIHEKLLARLDAEAFDKK
ncbi:MAG: UDP-N-acetylmuramate:L-alanyl-gamma-D-glutamyl-meso-diaminopimelate ligase [Burkholderiales bacterium]|jgi:UDP-N-acetylmuramate: L-alanyl-gamma-D-glutamyl-meso-diaminopimelate ligase|nr:UDP-N-acetylmuramate:L-alanyl-gamma-D-glutamyl-meso-diaminopimelate ligase [Burkholderiales bacterium]